ncbi:MAG: hypothetical protein OHK0013_15070 [Sandaracinaceae bacterium]
MRAALAADEHTGQGISTLDLVAVLEPALGGRERLDAIEGRLIDDRRVDSCEALPVLFHHADVGGVAEDVLDRGVRPRLAGAVDDAERRDAALYRGA